ncbi:30S ribosomal protein S10, mitochondrial precursor [Lophiotrema nucula]|uniref:Small ribosomal subunit protein uS10m n=1 Tax=Lophiotrema nucula TaxID=690887 RepID=A0A6A5YKA5_9PLEO|nr:30S ribosomal protein S10, mitochondrial precursor [Lophiotrema nucula]
MAAPRCTRSFLGPAKRLKPSTPKTPSRSFATTALRRAEDERFTPLQGDYKPFEDSQTLEERLEDLGIDAAEYKTLLGSQQKAEERAERQEPQTAKEARKQWQALQKTPDHNTLLQMYKRAGVEPIKLAKERGIQIPGGEKPPLDSKTQEKLDALRTPINVKALGLRPLRRAAEYGVPVCNLQLRTYSIRNMEFFADFAMRAAYYMGLPARGPVPLPRITERWTVPRANFIFKKSQENFERITMRRLIQIQDGHPDVVKAWLAFLQKHQYHGVGMKANIWEYESLEAATSVGQDISKGETTGRREKAMLDKVGEILSQPGFKEAMEGFKAPAENRL